MAVSDITGGLVLGAFLVQTALTSIQTATFVLESKTPPPIEAVGISPGKVLAGRPAWIDWTITKRSDCPGENARVWSGQDGFSLHEPLGVTTLPATGKPEFYSVQTNIPAVAPVGKLWLYIQGFYQCPGAEKVSFSLGPVEMEVIK